MNESSLALALVIILDLYQMIVIIIKMKKEKEMSFFFLWLSQGTFLVGLSLLGASHKKKTASQNTGEKVLVYGQFCGVKKKNKDATLHNTLKTQTVETVENIQPHPFLKQIKSARLKFKLPFL